MNLFLQKKKVVITGGSSGIGAETARLFQEEGAEVIILDRASPDNFMFPVAPDFYECDVSREHEVAHVLDKIKLQYDNIDILVNNAGIQRYGSVTETSSEVWDETLSINLRGIFLCAKYAIPLMKDPGGVIVNVASVMSFVAQQSTAAYVTSKSAILGLTRSIAIDYADRLRCVAVCPGAVDTPMLRHDLEQYENKEAILEETRNIHLLKRIAQPEEIAHFIVFLASPRASFATGQYYRVDGGIGIKIEGS